MQARGGGKDEKHHISFVSDHTSKGFISTLEKEREINVDNLFGSN